MNWRMFAAFSLLASGTLACETANLITSLTSPSPTPTRTRTPTRVLVSPPPPPIVVIPSPTPPVEVMGRAKENLRVRSAPSTAASAVDRLNKGDVVKILGRTAAKDWLQIPLPTNPNARGWVSAEFVQIDGPIDAIPIVQPGQPPTPRPYP